MRRRKRDAGESVGRRWRGRRTAAPDAGAPVGEGLHALLAAMGGTPGRAGLQNLWDNWEAALGAELAGLARPLGHHEGREKKADAEPGRSARGAVLLLGAGDAMLLQELRFRAGEILARVNGFLGQAYFSEVQVSLPLGRREPARSRPRERPAEAEQEAAAAAQAPSGVFLRSMDQASPVARCYARFAGRKSGAPAPATHEEGNIRKNLK